MVVWGPSSDTDPPYFSVWSGPKRGWIDRAGRWVPFEPKRVSTDPQGLTQFPHGGRIGYARDGVILIPPRFLAGGEFHEGRASVALEGPCVPADAGFCGARSILPPSARPANVTPPDAVSGRRPEAPPCRYTFIDESGEAAGPATFEDTRDFHEGIAAVRLKGRWGYVDRNASILIEPRFTAAKEFSEGLAAVTRRQFLTSIGPVG